MPPSPRRRCPRMISIPLKVILLLVVVYIGLSTILCVLLAVHPTVIRHLVFLNLLRTGTNFSQPESVGLERVSNFYLDVEPGVRLGIWHFRSPLVQDQSINDEDYFQKHLISTSSKIPILLYLHGNAFDRSFVNRRALCEKLRTELKYDVFSFDYRGFGDSTGEPTEEGLIKDARHVYDWLQRMTDGRRRIYIWGQSLGSAVACQLAARLSDDESLSNLAGLVMEAPFINIHQALQTHWFAVAFRWQPWFYGLTEKALRASRLAFLTRGHLSNVNCPCVLLHADDDYTIPYIHSKKLLEAAMVARDHHRKEKKLLHFQIDMISYHGAGHGHSLIHRDEKLVPALKRVIFDEDL